MPTPTPLLARPSARQRRRWGATAAAALLVLTGCSAPQADPSASPAQLAEADASSTAPTTSDASSSATAPETEATTPAGPAHSNPNVPMRRFAADETPPQFVLFSFDNGLHNSRWESFMATARESGAHFTVFHSAVNLLTPENRTAYKGPGTNKPGYMGAELGASKEDVAQRIRNMNQAYAEGNEIGTHYAGHLCAPTPYGGDKWTTKDWKQEIASTFAIYEDVHGINGFGDDVPQLEVPVSEIKGARQPCLNGKWDQLVPAWKSVGIEYDTSQTSGFGIGWPYLKDGIWEFEMPLVHTPRLADEGAKETKLMAMDYNFWVAGNRNHKPKDDTAWLRDLQLDTYRYMFESAYHGNRAPLVFGNHFSDWAGNAFNPAQDQAMRELCVREDTYCITYQQMVEWLKLQDPAVLKAWAQKPRAATGADVDKISWRPQGN